MADSVVCAICQTVLAESSSTPVEERKPCPICGGTSRIFNANVVSKLLVSGAISAEVLTGTGTGTGDEFAGLVVQAVVSPGEKTSEGQIIQAVALPWFHIIDLLEKNPHLAYEIDPRKWEELIAGWYKASGFDDVILTPGSGDFGRDVIAVKHGMLSIRIIDSVKRYAPNRPVDANDVRALLGVLAGDQNATKGVVTTTSTFAPKIETDPFIKPFIPYRLELVDGTELMRRLTDVADKNKGK